MTTLLAPRAIIFDLDGTLVDSRQDLALAVNAARRELGRPPLPVATIIDYVGDGVACWARSASRLSCHGEQDYPALLDAPG